MWRACEDGWIIVSVPTLKVYAHTEKRSPVTAPVSGWSQLANICRLPNERSIYIYIVEASEWNTSISHADTQIPNVAYLTAGGVPMSSLIQILLVIYHLNKYITELLGLQYHVKGQLLLITELWKAD